MVVKLRGKRLYHDGVEVAEIRGYREVTADRLHADFSVWQGGEKVAGGFCYFRDAVAWTRDVLRGT